MMLNTIQSHPLFQQVSRFVAQEQLLNHLTHIDVALSGGADSVCLLAILWAMQQTDNAGFTLRAHHIRHHLREDDKNDAAIARDVANILSIPYIQTDLNWDFEGKPQTNIEERAREARYAALFEALQSTDKLQTGETMHDAAVRMPLHSTAGTAYAAKSRIAGLTKPLHNTHPTLYQAIALAHHGDENVETMLWRLGRGCGLEGLCLAPYREQNHMALIRPLLGVSKESIYQFLNDCGLSWAEDPTNASDAYQRNRIRHQILPAVRAEAMSDAALYRSLVQIRHDADAMTALAKYFVTQQPFWKNAWFCPWAAWHTLETSALAQVLRHAARHVVSGCCPDARFIQQALNMIEKRVQTHRQIQQSQLAVAWSNGGIMMYPISESPVPQNLSIAVPCQDVDVWQLCRISAWYQTLETVPANTKSMLHIDATAVHGQLNIRPACHFQNLQTAVGNLCKTREALRSQGVPDCWRRFWPVLCDDDRPLWVLGGMRTLTAVPPKPGVRALTVALSWYQQITP